MTATNTALYPARIWKEDNIYYVQFVDLENAFTYGETLKKAKIMAADVLSALLTFYLEQGEHIPAATQKHGKNIYFIAPDARVQAALLLRKIRGSKTQVEVAEVMHTTWQAYQKIEQPTNNTTLIKLQKAVRALGKDLIIEFK
jgi:antitoxin HicB